MIAGDPVAQHAWWLASRASGLIALGLVTISTGLGLMMAGRLSRKPGAARTLTAIHEQTALTGLVAISVHGLTLLGDPWLNPGPSGISIPFAMSYRPVWTGLGITAGWLAAMLGLSFYARKSFGPRLWRKAHRATIVVYFLGAAHTIGAGTDGQSAWLLYPVLAASGAIAVLFALRMTEAARKSRATTERARATEPAPALRRPRRPAEVLR